jgi:electron transport complex protein RnfG
VRDLLRPVIVLALICVGASAALAFTYAWTNPLILKHEVKERNEALHKVLPEARTFKEQRKGEQIYYLAMRDGNQVGIGFITIGKGYGGDIKLIIGVDGEGKITGLEVLSHLESPGLGARITEDWFKAQFKGKTVRDKFKVKGPDADLDAIIGATISSRAVAKAVKEGLEAHAKHF